MSLSKLFAVSPILVALGACAPSSFVTNKSELLATGQRAALDDIRNASIVRNRHAAEDKYATEPHAAEAQNSSFGVASFYAEGSQTASGEKFDPNELTAASPTLPFGTRLRVTNVANKRSVVVRINDRGPFVAGRVVDVSYSAAETLGMIGQGTAKVKLDVVR
jgi:rare lipoprotein A